MASGREWQPRSWKHVPWTAIAAILICAGLSTAIAFILATSHTQIVATWPSADHPISVSVLLAVLVGLANLSLGVAISQAYAVAWWLKALKGASLQELHLDTGIEKDPLAIFKYRRKFDTFAIASFSALAFQLAGGPLMQRASTIGTRASLSTESNVTVHVGNQSLPIGFTWSIIDLPTTEFKAIDQAYSRRAPIPFPYEGCDSESICKLDFPAAGFDLDCSTSLVPYDFNNLTLASNSSNYLTPWNLTVDFVNQEQPFQHIDTERKRWFIHSETEGIITVSLLYKPDATCTGHFVNKTCNLRGSTVKYPITISNGTAQLSPWRPGTNETVSVTHFSDPFDIYPIFGGIASSIKSLYTSNANITLIYQKGQTLGFDLSSSGKPSKEYLSADKDSLHDCTLTWSDPTSDIFNTARELMFRSAIAGWGSFISRYYPLPYTQYLQAQRTTAAPRYLTDWRFFGIAMGLMLFQLFCIACLLWGSSALGRKVSLDMFELLNAFQAPMLRDAASNATTEDVIRLVGSTQVRYGEVGEEDGSLEGQAMLTTEGSAPLRERSKERMSGETEVGKAHKREARTYGDGLQSRLVFDLAERVGEPREGVPY